MLYTEAKKNCNYVFKTKKHAHTCQWRRIKNYKPQWRITEPCCMHTALNSVHKRSAMEGGLAPWRQALWAENTAWMYAAWRHQMVASRSAPSKSRKRSGSEEESPNDNFKLPTSLTTGQRAKCSMLSSILPQKVHAAGFWNLLPVHQPFSHNLTTAHRVDGGIHDTFCKVRVTRPRMMWAAGGQDSRVRHRTRRRSHITSGHGKRTRRFSNIFRKCACTSEPAGRGASRNILRASSAAVVNVETKAERCHRRQA